MESRTQPQWFKTTVEPAVRLPPSLSHIDSKILGRLCSEAAVTVRLKATRTNAPCEIVDSNSLGSILIYGLCPVRHEVARQRGASCSMSVVIDKLGLVIIRGIGGASCVAGKGPLAGPE